MKCLKCGTEMVWMGNVQIEIKDLDKYFHKLTKRERSKAKILKFGVLIGTVALYFVRTI